MLGRYPDFGEQVPTNPVDLGGGERFAKLVGAEIPESLLELVGIDRFIHLILADEQVRF